MEITIKGYKCPFFVILFSTLRKATDFVNLLIAGPDGNLWFSIDSCLPEYSAFGEMGRMTPQGTVTIFDLGIQKDWTKVPKSGTFVL